MKKTLVLSAVLALSLAPAASHADTFKGSILRGQLLFLNDPNVLDPSLGDPTNLLTGNTGFAGTRNVVGSGQEYSYDDGIATYSANANKDGITFRVKCDAGVSLRTCNTEPGFIWVLKDDVFATSVFFGEPNPDLVIGGGQISFNEILVVDLLSFDTTGDSALRMKNSKAILDVSPIPTPEPAGIALLGTGLLGVVGAARRRFRK